MENLKHNTNKNMIRNYIVISLFAISTLLILPSIQSQSDNLQNKAFRLINTTDLINNNNNFNEDNIIPSLLQKLKENGDKACSDLKHQIINLSLDRKIQEIIYTLISNLTPKPNKSVCSANEISVIIKKHLFLNNFFSDNHFSKHQVSVGVIESITNKINQNKENSNPLIKQLDYEYPLNNTQIVKNYFSSINSDELTQESRHSYTMAISKTFSPNFDFSENSILVLINQLFVNVKNKSNTKKFNSTVLFLIGDQCNNNSTNPGMVFTNKNNESILLTFQDVTTAWRNYQNFYLSSFENMPLNKKLLIIIDCPNSNLWINKCNSVRDCRDFSIQALSSNEKLVYKNDMTSFQLSKFFESQGNPVFNKKFSNSNKELGLNIKNSDSENLFYGFYFANLFNFGLETETTSLKKLIYKTTDSGSLYSKIKLDNRLVIKGNSNDNDKSTTTIGLIYDNNIIYVGEISKDNKKHGQGIYYSNKLNFMYEGAFEKNNIKGFGIKYLENDTLHGTSILEGDFSTNLNTNVEDTPEELNSSSYLEDQYGKIVSVSNHKTYIGEVKQNNYNGKGELFDMKGARLIGTFKDGKLHGKGRLLDGNFKYLYFGEFENGKKNGKGVINFGEGTKLKADFIEDKIQKEAEIYYSHNKTTLTVGIEDDKRYGPALMKNASGDEIYSGFWRDDSSVYQVFLDLTNEIESEKKEQEKDKYFSEDNPARNVHVMREIKKPDEYTKLNIEGLKEKKVRREDKKKDNVFDKKSDL